MHVTVSRRVRIHIGTTRKGEILVRGHFRGLQMGSLYLTEILGALSVNISHPWVTCLCACGSVVCTFVAAGAICTVVVVVVSYPMSNNIRSM